MNTQPTTDPDALRRLERRVFDLTSLVKAGRAMNDILDPHGLYDVLLAIIAEKLECGATALLLYDPEAHHCRLVKSRKINLPETPSIAFTPEEGLLWQNILQQEPFAVTDSGGSPLFAPFFRLHGLERLQSDLWTPLFLRANLIGILTLGRRPAGGPFDADDLSFLKQFAATAAASINTCTLYARREEERMELKRTFRNLTLLYDIGRAMTLISDLKQLLGFILEQAITVAHARKGSIMLQNVQSGALEVSVIQGMEDKTLQARINRGEVACRTFHSGEGVAGKVWETGRAIVLSNVASSADFVGSDSSFVASIACIPMRVYGDIIGVINVTNKAEGTEFSPEEISLLEAIADQAAISINKAQLWEMAVTDSLSGLFIRRYMLSKLSEELLRATRYHHPLAVLMMDIDKFKTINDTFGHDTGDAVIQRIATILKQTARNVDLVGRHGGEEFLLVLPETDRAQALAAAERLRTMVAETRSAPDPSFTISVGLSTFPEDGKTVEELVRCADIALFHSKSGGRNRVTTYLEGMTMPA